MSLIDVSEHVVFDYKSNFTCIASSLWDQNIINSFAVGKSGSNIINNIIGLRPMLFILFYIG